ncbi:hypothetical protein A1Q1_00346 [Trichosporon asahii var. asahii CBS 2479]|uniref:Metallo-beta-lactamase domain-containing protein n=1 Tax=Trichosporon asahii var. asahii (strain ATCC 90039 / CBS 2479 / JCM 2466 / KCTC 7840 / NBRC 103889/ NCYC 2677 / UAMH 7654) TaxID=1186058 RepID=J5R2H3_TRIAS|nr:hypothetical protein A1Q1_00346 [Trichosporon asahii var. asahii CBS 2479]EJT50368.1 hypothetical protein A1Q1_00346 [Trichosporon asahii var. asahii CBS 2479]
MPTNIKYLDEYEDKHNYRNIQVPDTASLEFEPLKPSPSKDAYCKVHLIKNSDLTMGLSVFVRTSDTDAQITLPVYTFMLEHVSDGRKVAFDLGLKPKLEDFSPFTQGLIKDMPITWPRGTVPEVLKDHGVDAKDVETVILSHVHFDHIGDIGQFPTSTKLIVGPGTAKAALPGYPTYKDSSVLDSDLPFGSEREVEELGKDTKWVRCGSFPEAVDYFGDGSLYILNAYGHMVGHIAALVRTSTDPDTYMLLAGDSAHVRGLYSCCAGCKHPSFRAGLYPASAGLSPQEQARGGLLAIHYDLPAAYLNMARMGRMEEEDNVCVILAHDLEWKKILDREQGGEDWEWVEVGDWKKKGRKEEVKKEWVYKPDTVKDADGV